MLRLSRDHWRAMWTHAWDDRPDECCGLLIGLAVAGRVTVTSVRPARNTWKGRRRHRYELDPVDHLRGRRWSRARGWSVVGFYHSHVGSDAVPSALDLARAWPGVVYVILSMPSRPSDSLSQNPRGTGACLCAFARRQASPVEFQGLGIGSQSTCHVDSLSGGELAVRAWRLDATGRRFEEEPIEVRAMATVHGQASGVSGRGPFG